MIVLGLVVLTIALLFSAAANAPAFIGLVVRRTRSTMGACAFMLILTIAVAVAFPTARQLPKTLILLFFLGSVSVVPAMVEAIVFYSTPRERRERVVAVAAWRDADKSPRPRRSANRSWVGFTFELERLAVIERYEPPPV